MADNNTRFALGTGASRVLIALLLVSSTALTTFTGCGSLDGEISTNMQPTVEFTNIPENGDTFSYAPVVYWKGRDSDGFVEQYMYADIIDSTALLDPQYYVSFIPDEAWITTESTSDTVYLLTESGAITQHVFYLKCIDDREMESPVIYRTFFRSNRPPEVPKIKWYTDPDDADHLRERITVDDTLYCLDGVTESWPGLGFSWRSSDPDDRELYRIPLQFRYYLEKVPHDTIWEWVSPNWTTRQDITLSRLETGHYTLSVWARDDGYELSERPAVATFDVFKPTFEQSILLLNTTKEGITQQGFANVSPGTQIGELYQQLVASSNYNDFEYLHYTVGDSVLPKSYISRFKLVIYFSENKDGLSAPYERTLRDYVNIGGRLWSLGIYVGRNFHITSRTLDLAESSFPASPGPAAFPGTKAEFTAAISGAFDLPTLKIDTSKTGSTFRRFWGPTFGLYPTLPGIDIMTAGSGAETAYTFASYTDTASGDMHNQEGFVRASVDTINDPPTPYSCMVVIEKQRVLNVSRVENITRGVIGNVKSVTNNIGVRRQALVRITYPFSEPWSVDDSIVVDYEYQPFSDYHLKPVGIRYEKVVVKPGGSYEVRYRVAAFTFPLYYLDNSTGDVTRMFNSMLDWFFYPFAH